jgi:hypothetical protein
MKAQCSIVTLVVGVTLALASAAQADRWGQDGDGLRSLPAGKVFAAKHPATHAKKAVRLGAGRACGYRDWCG